MITEMTPYPSLDPSPFILEGGTVGVLLIHGFTGSPTEMRLVGEYLNQHKITVSAPCLPGHGTTLDDLNQVGSTQKEIITLHNSGHVLTLDKEWEEVAEQTYQFLKKLTPSLTKN